MNMGAKTLLSLEEFLALPDDDKKYELDRGELVVKPMAGRIQVRIAGRIHGILFKFADERRIGEVYSEAQYVLAREPEGISREPDVSFLSKERLRAMPEGTHFEGAPELVVEVVSPSNTAEELDLKIEQYLAAGAQEVWLAYPKTRSVHIHKPDGQILKLRDSDTISCALFPGWSARIADFFNLDY